MPESAVLMRNGNTYRGLVLHQALIIAAQGSHKHQAVHAFEAMYPLLPLRSLTANVEHVVLELTKLEQRLRDASCSESGSEDVLIIGQVVFRKQAIYTVVVAAGCQCLGMSPILKGLTIGYCRAAHTRCRA